MLNIQAAWIGILAGILAGMIQGMFFHLEDFLGGYSSWQRRLTRLGHISLFGIGFINLAFGLTTKALGLEAGLEMSSALLVVGAITMPAVCYSSAFYKPARNLFFIPVLSLIIATSILVWKLLSV